MRIGSRDISAGARSRQRRQEDKLIGRPTQVVFITEDVAAKFQDWSKRGVRFHHPPETPAWGGIFTSLEDLDGNSFALLQANLRSQCAIAFDQPQRLLQSVNQLFYENTNDSAYATLLFAEYDDKARRLRYASCGHFSALLLRSNNTLERLHSTCTVLGLFKQWDCSIEERRLFPGDTLAFYTDGVTESLNDAGEEFGEQRLIEVLRRHRESSSQALLASIVEEVRQFSPHEQEDDIT